MLEIQVCEKTVILLLAICESVDFDLFFFLHKKEMVLARRVREELRPIVLTEVHNVGKNSKEVERILKAGGQISESQKRIKHPRFPMCTISVSRSL